MKIELTRGERFSEARTVYNHHGPQTIAQVAAETGISASLISDLENDDRKRGVAFEKVATLAKHYGVSLDYLSGIEDYHSRDPDIQSIVKSTGLTEDSLYFLRGLNTDPERSPTAQNTLTVINMLLSDTHAGENLLFWERLQAFMFAEGGDFTLNLTSGTGYSVPRDVLLSSLLSMNDNYLIQLKKEMEGG